MNCTTLVGQTLGTLNDGQTLPDLKKYKYVQRIAVLHHITDYYRALRSISLFPHAIRRRKYREGVEMKENSWICTIFTQLTLCIALYIALNIGQPQKHIFGNSKNEGRPIDMYFISIAGGFRPLEEQTLLLKQMEKVVTSYKARFIVNINELGESDPLLQNATWYPELQKLPWYTTRALKGEGANYFLQKIKIPYGQTLDIIALNTGLLQGSSSIPENEQLQWLTTTLKESSSDWKIVFGFHQLVTSEDHVQKMEPIFERLYSIFLNYGVNAYWSWRADNVLGGTVRLSNADPMDKRPYLTAANQNLVHNKEMVNGFLLHRVSPLEIVTYLVKLTGEVVQISALQQMGKEVM
ncbi:Calcineurin-like metallo-phosphoesterase superfamily protein [Abeliophyllum distichum]|uniref:Calcineurin-like metallo-phosphoesterase superfamily protein n=1 Tax=Abeliophyllum distichum TaxID=126358 RepID=A0ABD1QY94_9LAMI